MISNSVLCSSFKLELLSGVHNFLTQSFKLALYGENATLNADTVAYVAEGEIAGLGYIPGGQVLANPQINQTARVGFVTFDDPAWPNSLLTARGALLYNDTVQQRAVGVLNFGANRTSNNGLFRVHFPTPGPSTSLIRIA